MGDRPNGGPKGKSWTDEQAAAHDEIRLRKIPPPPLSKPRKWTSQEIDQEIADYICDCWSNGFSLSKICSQPGMPSRATVKRWLDEFPEFEAKYARARELREDHFAEEIVEIADEEPDPARARVRMDARKWAASQTGRYGERRIVSGDANNPLAVRTTNVLEIPEDMSLEELEALERALRVTVQAQIEGPKPIEGEIVSE